MKLFGTWYSTLIAGAAAALLLYSTIGFLLFPLALKKIGVRELTHFLGRTVTIRKIEFNPYTLTLGIRGFQVDEPNGGAILSWNTLRTTLAPFSSLVNRTLVLKEAVLLEPRVSVVRNANGTLNFADLLLLDWPKAIRLRVALVRIEDGKVIFVDAAVPGGFSTTISRLTTTVKDFSTSPDHENVFSVGAVSESGEEISWNGFFRADPLSSHGEVAAENIRMSTYDAYFKDRVNFTIADGTLAARATYDVDLARDRFKVRLNDGTIALHSLKVYERGSKAPLFGFGDLAITDAQADMVRKTIGISTIVITGGSVVVRRLPDNSFNVQHLTKPEHSPTVTRSLTAAHWTVAAGEIRLADFAAEVVQAFGRETIEWKELLFSKPKFETNPFSASVAAVTLRSGELRFTDVSMEPPVSMALTQLNAHVGAFSSADPRSASVEVRARVGDVQPLQISGVTNPISAQGVTNIRGLLQNVDLTPLSPYAARYLGYELKEGKLSLDLTFLLQRRMFNAQSRLEIDRLTLGRKSESKDATKLPVHLAIALLKDASGKIMLNVPIEIALDHPRFEFQNTIIGALLNPFKKAAAFPFTAFGAQMGGGGEELGFQEFSSGSSELVPQESGKLDTILQGLERYPEIMLDIEGSVDRNDTGDLQILAADRARAVKEYLLRPGTLEPDRIFLIDDALENVPRKGSRALLSLKYSFPSPQPSDR